MSSPPNQLGAQATTPIHPEPAAPTETEQTNSMGETLPFSNAAFARILRFEQFNLEDARRHLDSNNVDDIRMTMHSVSSSVDNLEEELTNVRRATARDDTTPFEEFSKWAQAMKEEIKEFKNMTQQLKKQLNLLEHRAATIPILPDPPLLNKQPSSSQSTSTDDNPPPLSVSLADTVAATTCNQHTSVRLPMSGTAPPPPQHYQPPVAPVAVKLQKYTISPFQGDYRDWLRFWQQFSVEIDQSGLAQVSKFHYLLEMLHGEPKEEILGLPHTAAGYEEAKTILVDAYGKDHQMKAAFIQDLEELPHIQATNRIKGAHSFYKVLNRTVRTLRTLGALSEVEGMKHSILKKLGPIREIIIMKEPWETWNLQDIVHHLGRFVACTPIDYKETSA